MAGFSVRNLGVIVDKMIIFNAALSSDEIYNIYFLLEVCTKNHLGRLCIALYRNTRVLYLSAWGLSLRQAPSA